MVAIGTTWTDRGSVSMRNIGRRMALLLVAVCTLVAFGTAGASASTGPKFLSADQAGYAGTGASFSSVSITAKLPQASSFAANLGQVAVSVQLSNRHIVIDLTVAACTDTTCRPGGKPVALRYHVNLSVFNAATHALICSTSGKGSARCQYVPADWNQYRIAAGQTVAMSLFYASNNGYLDAEAGNQNNNASEVAYQDLDPGPGIVFDQARIVAQFGPTPWSTSGYRAPKSAVRIINLGVPPPPPYEAEFATTNSGRAYCVDAWWPHHLVAMTSGGSANNPEQAAPTATWGGSCDFGIDLKP